MKLRIYEAFALGGVMLAPGIAYAADIHVDGRNAGSENGSEAGPYRTVGAAVKAAKKGDRIKIAAGSYGENIDVRGKSLVFEGGFPGAPAETYAGGGSGNFAQSDPKANETTLQGKANAPVLFAEGTIETTVLGLVLKGGKHGIEATADPETRGKLVVRHSRIENNGNATVHGGGIRAKTELFLEDSVVRDNVGEKGSGVASGPARTVILRTVIENNVSHGDHGGGLYAVGAVEILGSLFRNNRVGETAGYGWGGGLIVFNKGTKALIADTEVTGNFSPTKGSGVFVDDGAEATLRNVLIVNNRCSKEGGALYIDGLDERLGSRADLVNVTIAGHDCGKTGYGNAIVMERASVMTVASSIFWNNGPLDASLQPGNTLSVRYSNTKDSFPGPGNLRSDPLFANADAGDYRLKNQAGRWDPVAKACVKDSVTSPCVDTGDPEGAFDREPQPHGGRVDMGAYGNSPLAGCATQQSLAAVASAPSSTARSLGPSSSGAARGRCGCDVPGASAGSACAVLVAMVLAFAGISRRRRGV
jgi:hypothetical protein